jgi:ferritin-like metal-binding protein YciE
MFYYIHTSSKIRTNHFYMKKRIESIQDALCYQLQGLLYTERKVREEFFECGNEVTSVEARNEIEKYIATTDNKLLKLERIFNYLMHEPDARENEVINKLIDETHHMIAYTNSPHLRDVLVLECIQNINAYKIATYKSAYLFAIELELDTAEELLQQILEWEIEAAKTFDLVSVHEFNRMNRLTNIIL